MIELTILAAFGAGCVLGFLGGVYAICAYARALEEGEQVGRR